MKHICPTGFKMPNFSFSFTKEQLEEYRKRDQEAHKEYMKKFPPGIWVG